MLLLGNVVTAVIVQAAMAGLLELYSSFEWVSTLIVAVAVAFYFSPAWHKSSDGNAHSILDNSQAVDLEEEESRVSFTSQIPSSVPPTAF